MLNYSEEIPSFEIFFRDQLFVRYSKAHSKIPSKILKIQCHSRWKIHVFVTFSATMAAAIGDYWSAGMKERRQKKGEEVRVAFY